MKTYKQNYGETWREIAEIVKDFPTYELKPSSTNMPEFADIIQKEEFGVEKGIFTKRYERHENITELLSFQLTMPKNDSSFTKTAHIKTKNPVYNKSLLKLITEFLEANKWQVEFTIIS